MAGTAAAAAAALPRSRLRYGKDAAGKEILIMMSPGEEEKEEAVAAQNQDEVREAPGCSNNSRIASSHPSTTTAAAGAEAGAGAGAGAAAKPYQGSNTIVMMEWEKEYMETLVEALALREEDEVLEIGWGLGYSATAIQKYRPQRHVIIECDPGVMARAEEWKKTTLKNEAEDEEGEEEEEKASGSNNNSSSSSSSSSSSTSRSIVLVQGYWQQVLPSLGQFSAVLLDDFPLPVEGPGAEDEARVLASTGGSRWHHFLDLIVSHHLRPGGRVTGYLSRDLELGRADCSYTRQPVEVLVSPNCTYATPGWETYFVPLVTRRVMGGKGGGGGGGVGFITGRMRGDLEITRQDQGEGGERQGGMASDSKAARKRRRMLAYVLKERGDEEDDDE